MSKNTTKKLQSNPKRNDFVIAQILSNFSTNIYVGFGLIFLKNSVLLQPLLLLFPKIFWQQ